MKTSTYITLLFIVQFLNCYSQNTDTSNYAKYILLAKEARKSGNNSSSINYLLTARNYSESKSDSLRIFNSLGSTYYKASDYHTALSYYDSCTALIDSSMPAMYKNLIIHNYALVYMQLEEFEKAIESYLIAAENFDSKSMGLLYFNLAKCYDYLNEQKNAKEYYLKAYNYNNSILGNVNYYSILAGLELAEHDKKLLHELLQPIKELDNQQLYGLYYSLSGDFKNAEKYFKGNNDQLLKFYDKSHQWFKAVSIIDTLRNSYLSLESKLFLQKNELSIYKQAVDSSIKLNNKTLAFYYAQKSYSNILRDSYESNLPSNEDSYNYFDFDSVIYLFICKNGKPNFHKIQTDSLFWNNYESFISLFNNRQAFHDNYYSSYLSFCKKGNFLFKRLIPEISDEMLIIPHGRLQFLQFECLPTTIPEKIDLPDYKKIDYLIKHTTIHYDYILKDYAPSNKRLAITAIAPDTTLTYALEEVKSLRLFKADRLIGCKANKASIGINTGILHIATHYNPKDKLINFYDGTVHLDNLPKLKHDLVILSTCKNGDGLLYTGEGILSLGRAFYSNGAESVVESLWNASDESSYFIIWNFYKHLFTRKNKAESLRMAKLKYIKNCPHQISHPFYWGNYRLSGNNSKVWIRLNPSVVLIGLGILLLFVISIKYVLSRK